MRLRYSLAAVSVGLLILLGSGLRAATAQEVFRNPAMEANPEFQKAYSNARLLLERGRLDEAIEEYRKAAKLKEDKCPECFEMIGQIFLINGQHKEAAVAYRQAIELKPGNEAEIHNALGVVLFLQKEKSLYVEAANEFQRAIDLSKGAVVKAYYNLGHTFAKLGKTDEAKTAFKTYLEKLPDAKEATEVRALIANPGRAGDRFAPGFNVKSTKGEMLSLDSLRGKVVVLDFWASWCGPCREDMPEVRKIWKTFNSDKFVLVGINLDRNQRDFEQYVKEQSVVWPQYYDGKGWGNKLARLYDVHAIPHTVLIGPDGVIHATGLRGARLSRAIGDLLKKVPAETSKSGS
jgi:tetratricopeptide (TPR) repeat protein